MTVVRPGALSSCEQDGRFDLGRGDGRAIFDRGGIAGAFEHDRTAPAFALGENLSAHEPQGIEDAPHRPLAERGVAVEGCGDSVAANHPHHQPAAGAGVAEIEGVAGARSAPRPGPRIRHCPGAETLGDGAQSLASLAGPEHIVTLEQTLDLGLAAGQEAKQKRAMRDRFVSRRLNPPFERSRALGAERRGRGWMRRMGGHFRIFLRAEANSRAGDGRRSYHRRWKLSITDPYSALTGRRAATNRTPAQNFVFNHRE